MDAFLEVTVLILNLQVVALEMLCILRVLFRTILIFIPCVPCILLHLEIIDNGWNEIWIMWCKFCFLCMSLKKYYLLDSHIALKLYRMLYLNWSLRKSSNISSILKKWVGQFNQVLDFPRSVQDRHINKKSRENKSKFVFGLMP